MRFEFKETVQTSDHERVLRTLERCLQDVSTEIARAPRQITFRGLGPSSRVMNPKDTTVIVLEVENNNTIIDVHVNYQASSLLGETAQDEIVRQKLDCIFQQMKARLAAEEDLTTELPNDNIRALATLDPPEIQATTNHQLTLSETPIMTDIVDDSAMDQSESESPAHLPSELQPKPLFQGKQIGKSTYAIALLLSIMVAFVTVRRVGTMRATPETELVIQPIAKSVNDRNSNRVAESVSGKAKQLLQDSSGSRFDNHADDPHVWLMGWVAAMRSRDAAAQASFYADPTDRYLNDLHVTRYTLLNARRTAIANRRGLWTIKAEKITIKRSNGSSVDVRLVKHSIEQPGDSKIEERFVRTKLILKRVSGSWKITSEREMP
jgi:hypothetical protein